MAFTPPEKDKRFVPPKSDRPKGVFESISSQGIAGLNDVTGLLARPLEMTLPTVVFNIGDDRPAVEILSPDEVTQRRQEGTIGVPGMATDKPGNIFGDAARVGGQALVLASPLGRLAGKVSAPARTAVTRLGKGKEFVQGAISTAGQTFARAPVKGTAIEGGLGAGAGAGGFVAEKIFPDSGVARFIGEVIGSSSHLLIPARLAIKGGNWLWQKAKGVRETGPTSLKGGRDRAIRRTRRAIPESRREQALSELDRETTTLGGEKVLTPAQQSGAPGALELERAVMESSSELLQESNLQISRANRAIQESLPNRMVAESAVVAPVVEAQKYLGDLLDTRLKIAAQRTDERIRELGPSVDREQANLIAREELGNALEAARRQEKELWNLVPEDTPVPFTAAKDALDAFKRQLGGAQQGDIPAIAKKFLGENSKSFWGKNIPEGLESGQTTIREVRALQTKLREVARNSRKGDNPNFNRARVADGIADAIDDDLKNITADPEIIDLIDTAREFSFNKKQRFNQGEVGKILGRASDSGPRVAPGLTLEQSIGVTGPKARESLDGLLKAFDSPEAPSSGLLISAAEDFTRSRFLKETVTNGRFSVESARRFVSKNEELLKRLPGLQRQLDEVIESGNTLAVRQRQKNRIRLDDPRVSKATMLIERGPMETFRQISKLKPAEAERQIQQLINRVSKDQTGEAADGLKSAFIEFLLSQSREKVRDVDGLPFVSGFAFRDALENPAMRAAANRLFNKEELNRIGVVTRDLIRLEKRRGIGLPKEGVIGDTPSKVVETLAGLTGAAVGRTQARNLGIGGTVQIPGIFADRFRALANAGVRDPASRLLRDMVMDEKLFKELMTAAIEGTVDRAAPVDTRRLNAWFAAVLAEHGGAFENQE